MEINFDLIVAGCNTRCKHCYVAGGPGPMMPVDDALLCIRKLDEMAAYLPQGTTFTLDNEPMNHPHLDKILHAAAHTRHIKNHHHGMTTGIGLLRRADKVEVLRSYRENGYETFGLTLHGIGPHHDQIVRRNGAFDALLETARFLKAHGGKLELSLMLNRFFPEDWPEISRLLDALQPDFLFAAVPIFTPHRNMLDFEPYRGSLADLQRLSGCLRQWGIDEDSLLSNSLQNTPSSLSALFRQQPDLSARFAQPQQELYLTVHPDGLLYVGNTSAETRLLGELRTLDLHKTATIINSLPGNRDYGAYYNVSALPHMAEICQALEELPQELAYGDTESVLYRALVHLGVPTILLSNHP